MDVPVDLVMSCFERTYRTVLKPGFFSQIERQNCAHFKRRVALINNVEDRAGAEQRARALLESGEIDACHWVSDHLDGALKQVGMTRRDLGRIPHYSDWALVMHTLPGSEWVLHWDPDLLMVSRAEWVDTSIALMEADARVMVANPNWSGPRPAHETLEECGDFALGYGFSDQVYLVRRADLAQPIYGCRCLASLRYPLAHIASTFEKRVDAYMRTHRRLRATHTQAMYVHAADEGASYPADTVREKAGHLRNRIVVKLLRQFNLQDPCLRV
jgi:hypothetical protein